MATIQILLADMDNDTVGDQVTSRCSVANSTSGWTAEPEVVMSRAGDEVSRLLWSVCGPTLLVVGLVGNVLILVTMSRRSMRGTSTCVYLCAMAVLDLMVLAAALTHNWLEGAQYVTIQVSQHTTSLPPPKKEVMFLVRSVCLFVCLSVGLLANL